MLVRSVYLENKMPDEDMLEEIEEAGRDTDSLVGHLTAGEIVIPRQIADNADAQKVIKALFESYDVDMEEFTVGHEKNKINPETGYPEFFLKKAFNAVTGVVKSVVGTVAGALGLKPPEPPPPPPQKSAAELQKEADIAKGPQIDTARAAAESLDMVRRRRAKASNILAGELSSDVDVGVRQLLGR